jgi:hypothetical protein
LTPAVNSRFSHGLVQMVQYGPIYVILLRLCNTFFYNHHDFSQLALGAFSSYDTAPAPVFKGLPTLLAIGAASSPSRRSRSPVSSRRGWKMQASRLDGEAQSQARLSQPQRRARVRRKAHEAALGHAGGGEQGRCCFCRRRPATMKCACRTCEVRDRESVPSQPMCEPVNDGVVCAAGDLSCRNKCGRADLGGAYLMSAHPPGHAVSCMQKPKRRGCTYRKRHGQVGGRS